MWIAEQNGETASLPAAYLRSQVIWCEALQVMCEARFQVRGMSFGLFLVEEELRDVVLRRS